MGTQGIRKGLPRTLVLDAGALIGLERGNPEVAAMLFAALAVRSRVFVPATTLAQAWRGGPRSARLSRLLSSSRVDPLDEDRAKEVGLRLGRMNRADVADAHVVSCAVHSGATVVSSDADDIRVLVAPGERVRLMEV